MRAGASSLCKDGLNGVGENVPRTAGAVWVGGNGFRAVGTIQALEDDLGVPVLTANQVLCWHLLRLAGTRAPVVGYGRIFGRGLPA